MVSLTVIAQQVNGKDLVLPWPLSKELRYLEHSFYNPRSLCIERGGYQVMSFLAGVVGTVFG